VTTIDVLRKVAISRGVSVSRLRGKTRGTAMSRIRHESMFLLWTFLHMSLPEVQRALWLKNHTSVLYGIRKIQHEILDRPEYEVELRGLVA
jgi:chromosomal replication initiation ATPase DnaA